MAVSQAAQFYSNFHRELPPAAQSLDWQQSPCNDAAMIPTPSPSPHSLSSPIYYCEEEMAYDPDKVYLKIVEQPVPMFRFRYRSEMNGAHGSLLGRGENPKKKTYPTVQLVNFEGEATIRCSLYTASTPPKPHMHQLIAKPTNQAEILDHEISVSDRNGYKAEFRGLGIVHMAKKNLTKELVRKKEIYFLEKLKTKVPLVDDAKLKSELKRHLSELEKEAKKEAETMDPNKLRLCFEAFQKGPYGEVKYLCREVYSDTIQNMKSAETGGLKICRIDKCAGTCLGGDEIYILVEKVCKNNVQIRFYEEDENGHQVWCDYGVFNTHDVHHQYAIVFRTPPYKSSDIGQNVSVKLELVRPKDDARSESVTFTYKPARRYGKRLLSPYSSHESTSNSFEAQIKRPKPPAMVSDTDPMLSGEKICSLNFSSDAIKEALNNLETAEMDENFTDFRNFLESSEFKEYSQAYHEDIGNSRSEETQDTGHKECMLDSEHQYRDTSPMMPLDVYENFGELNIGNSPWEAVTDGARPLKSSNNKPEESIVTDGTARTVEDKMNRHTSSLAKNTCDKLLKLMKSRHPGRIQDMKNIIRAEQKEFGPLHAAVIHGQLKELGDLLSLVIKSNQLKLINTVNRRRQTPLMVAVEENQIECLRLLCMAKADVNQADYEENTALHIAAKNKNAACLEVILSTNKSQGSTSKIDLNRTNEKGETPLHIAVMKKDVKCATLLVNAGAELNVKTGTAGSTPLHIAIEVDSIDIVKLLLSQEKINVNEVNFAEKTPADLINPSQKSMVLLFKEFQGDLNEEIVSGNQGRVEVGNNEDFDEEDIEEDDDNHEYKDSEGEDEEEEGDVEDDEDEDEDEDVEDEAQDADVKKELVDTFQRQSYKAMNNVQDDDKDLGDSDSDTSSSKKSYDADSAKGDFSLIDDATKLILIESLNKDKKWRIVCENLNCGFLKRIFSSVPSPSRILLNYLEFEKKTSLVEFKNALENLNVPEATEALDNLLNAMK